MVRGIPSRRQVKKLDSTVQRYHNQQTSPGINTNKPTDHEDTQMDNENDSDIDKINNDMEQENSTNTNTRDNV
ncbi:hypothetical protein FQA39_LY05167 [Lamprigera yunnana]|nr:hypothetical protein FQA39_LY05167 [Lamprigera yunnana]